ncbi:MAG TPA: amidohydrolase [Amaricoccus sp.]|uniref:amidohydrolase n=1 Tax=Amaricoccus sp. TaxID=1872485 RepID=UPI001D9BB973|nr:amidohydrolase [Amaricoccus sp.]MCB1372757.1 amidohydrolase [Paracoccaceae bacterium]MCC0067146.1 amidohydrolase [Rhodovulum sp.]MCB1402831.1 amidohydrolase [Paracoccaceae bacterium]HPG22252.1 amidohydrolase [Amaricoccus sp.]HRW13872.1 amidohydrolase [Amaricoccus sp.]
MAVINRMADFAGDMAAWRRDLHGIPELDFDLFETAAYVAARLREIGVDEIHEGIARTGIVGIIRGRGAGRVIGLRADMDALPIAEVRDLPYRSRHAGRMHACGHDGHMAILLGAARYLAETRNFAGSVALIFQPSEEMSGGARVMCAEGLMARFGIESVFALHNKPGMALGRIGTRVGPVMAAADQFEILVRGRGAHAGYPHQGIDPMEVAVGIVQALYSIPARRVDPLVPVVVSPTVLQAGTISNVIAQTALLAGTVRSLDETLRRRVGAEIAEVVEAVAAAAGAQADLRYEYDYPVTVNHAAETALALRAAAAVVGADNVDGAMAPEMVAEDFAFMLQERPGAYVLLGTGPGAGLHHPEFDYNDEASPIGASYFARLVETAMPLA